MALMLEVTVLHVPLDLKIGHDYLGLLFTGRPAIVCNINGIAEPLNAAFIDLKLDGGQVKLEFLG